uniref:Ribosomal protein S11 n=1 Tax=prasinophyte sp. MBIC10622 TaxID=156113 RepID=A0A650AKJ2_9CHLO|nr:ribosomal protein S11 [prasinophyte sp. MBIC10622]
MVSKSQNTQRRESRLPVHALAHIQTTLNNTIITLTTLDGDTLLWGSAGSMGFRGSRGSTSYAAQVTAENVSRRAHQRGVQTIDVRTQGMGYGKESSLRGLQIGGLKVLRIVDTTLIPHNGCRPPKRRRV